MAQHGFNNRLLFLSRHFGYLFSRLPSVLEQAEGRVPLHIQALLGARVFLDIQLEETDPLILRQTGTIIKKNEFVFINSLSLIIFLPMILDFGGNISSQVSVSVIKNLSNKNLKLKLIL